MRAEKKTVEPLCSAAGDVTEVSSRKNKIYGVCSYKQTSAFRLVDTIVHVHYATEHPYNNWTKFRKHFHSYLGSVWATEKLFQHICKNHP